MFYTWCCYYSLTITWLTIKKANQSSIYSSYWRENWSVYDKDKDLLNYWYSREIVGSKSIYSLSFYLGFSLFLLLCLLFVTSGWLSPFARVEFPQLSDLFHCYLGIATRENTASYCSGSAVVDALPWWCKSSLCLSAKKKIQASGNGNSRKQCLQDTGLNVFRSVCDSPFMARGGYRIWLQVTNKNNFLRLWERLCHGGPHATCCKPSIMVSFMLYLSTWIHTAHNIYSTGT